VFVLSVETCFWAWHQLKLPDGQTEPAHGHHWVVIADVSSDRLDTMGLVMDFRDLKAALDGIVAGFNNRQLDRLEPFSRNNPSAENVAKYIYEKLYQKVGKKYFFVSSDVARHRCILYRRGVRDWIP